MGEFVGGVEPEFEGAVEGAVLGERNSRDAAPNGGLQAVMVLRGSGLLEGQESLLEAFREGARAGEDGGQGGEVSGVAGIGTGQGHVGGAEIGRKGMQEFDETDAADLVEDGGLGELG